MTNREGRVMIEQLMQELRQTYPLLRIESSRVDADTLHLVVEEGKLSEIRYELSRGWTNQSVIEKEIEFDTLSPLLLSKVEQTVNGLYNTGILTASHFGQSAIGIQHRR
jgi:hypothetical protein